ncbi:hypothetical protein BDV11DRAFT_111914 [Aspergillus similis]
MKNECGDVESDLEARRATTDEVAMHAWNISSYSLSSSGHGGVELDDYQRSRNDTNLSTESRNMRARDRRIKQYISTGNSCSVLTTLTVPLPRRCLITPTLCALFCAYLVSENNFKSLICPLGSFYGSGLYAPKLPEDCLSPFQQTWVGQI